MKPCKRRDFIKKLKILGFVGPYSGSKHQFMTYKNQRLTIPSNDDYSVSQLKMLLKQANIICENLILEENWNKL